MNRKIVIIILILIAGGVGYAFLDFAGTHKEDPGQASVVPSRQEPPTQQAQEQDLSEDERRRAKMRAEYAELELSRDTVRRRLGKLRTRVWKLQVSPDQARTIREQMQQGYAALKNPPMLGAFSSVDDIRKNMARVKVIDNKLKTLEITVQENITAQETR